MKVKTHIDPSPPLHPVLATAFLNFVLVVLLMIVFFSFFATPAGFEIRLPVLGVANNGLDEGHVTIQITGENVLYFNDKVVTINELKRALTKVNGFNTVIYLRVDRRASMGRIADVWDMCKGMGLARIKVMVS